VVTGGVISSTLLTLLVLSVLYDLVETFLAGHAAARERGTRWGQKPSF
jgi:Cu/Ag efflux pump CusA